MSSLHRRKNALRGTVAAAALVASFVFAAPAYAASAAGVFTCGNGLRTQMYSPSGYDYHQVNNRFSFWAAPSNFTTQVDWPDTSGSWYLESNTGFNYSVSCR